VAKPVGGRGAFVRTRFLHKEKLRQGCKGSTQKGMLKEMTRSVELDFAQLDLHRRARIGISEAVYAPGKTPEQCVAIISQMLGTARQSETCRGPVLLSRANQDQLDAVSKACPGGIRRDRLVFWNPLDPEMLSEPATASNSASDATASNSAAPNSTTSVDTDPTGSAPVAIATAGTGDLPTARECAGVLEAYGVKAKVISDVGVAGIHRTLAVADCFKQAHVVVVVAGMEGALASVVGGLTPAPVVAVPSSVGYGSSFEGITALLAMLSSCAPGVAVVGIDNGFGAACAVLRILNHTAHQPPALLPTA